MLNSITELPEGVGANPEIHSLAIRILVVVFNSIALYNAIELVILIFLTFNRYSGLYFWSLLLSGVLGVIPHAIGHLLQFFRIGPIGLAISIATIGFYFMVPGQSFVLYSRLHLVVQNQKHLRRVLYLIIIDSIVLLIPTTVLNYLTVYVGTQPVIKGYNVVERMQISWFAAQEMFISGIYIVETIRLLRLWPDKASSRNKLMYELIAINLVMVLLDVALLVLEYLGLYTLQVTIKAAVYSVKLKLEFGVLRKLVSLVHAPQVSSTTDIDEYPTFVDPSQITGDVTHAAPVNQRSSSRRWDAISLDSLVRSERNSRHFEHTEPP
ncbi:hypothetical protein ALT_4894 [Aspergillus lentulus]|uniref:DUF7703 domain-containing protein n=1 Tax=Aspergillus lentulus TaxID=293939 RepID=A0AAN4PK42_ASPLE|nr:hypothetical protein CNMCM6069_005491 [Aspergillus lentulus]KAF4175095.1 hypothetical protein CNMCM8060_007789 [Aspergillus lentulus]KAF4186985.1 hypothetical protein CNMCM7927_004720 [Aspergillus lentulus]KAF4196234.1 hypothetical protein CNMCM8694_005328 [Aspergillus lentulus]KAF4201134.1 hypothetical protein CNMCM8927_001977 [Aspergillus lentulus]